MSQLGWDDLHGPTLPAVTFCMLCVSHPKVNPHSEGPPGVEITLQDYVMEMFPIPRQVLGRFMAKGNEWSFFIENTASGSGATV